MSDPAHRMLPAAPRFRPVRLGPRDVVVQRRADGALLLRSPHRLGPYPPRLTERLEYWAARAPDRVLFAQRDATGGWRNLSYAAALDQARRVAQGLDRAGLVGDAVQRPRQRRRKQAQPEHLRRLRGPLAAAIDGGGDAGRTVRGGSVPFPQQVEALRTRLRRPR